MQLAWGASTHPGTRRPTNEDSYCAREDLGLFVVADGMGGHQAGEVASHLAVLAIEALVVETATLDAESWPVPYEPALGRDANRLRAAFLVANHRLRSEASRSLELTGMATTASALLVDGARAAIAHVGDSRVYLLRSGVLTRVTEDHSWVEEQVRAGTLSARDARAHPWRSVVTRALAGGTDPEIDLIELDLRATDRLLLCSDGLSAVLSDAQIARTLGGPERADQVADRLVSRANQGGGPDNVTILIVDIRDR